MSCTVNEFISTAQNTVWPVFIQAYPPNSGFSVNGPVYPPNGLLWMLNMGSRWQNRGCDWWANRVDHWTDQLTGMNPNPNSPQGQYHLNLKNAKIAFAQQMHTLCACVGPPPALIGQNPGQITLEAYNQKEQVDAETGTFIADLFSGKMKYKKVITSFVTDTKDISQYGEARTIEIRGDEGASFSLEIKNEDSSYYNFSTNSFQSNQTKLKYTLDRAGFKSINITYPPVTDADQYDFIFLAENYGVVDTVHANYSEVKFDDGSVDINKSTGSDSKIIKKSIYQPLNATLTISAISPNSLAGWGSVSITTDTFSIARDKQLSKVPFKITIATAATRAMEKDQNPTSQNIALYEERVVGSAPENIEGEDIYPAVRDTDSVDGAVTSGSKVVMDTNVANKMAVGDKITASTLTDTVDGEVRASGTKRVMDYNVETKMQVGDLVTSTAGHFLNIERYKVAALNPDEDNVKEFQINPALPSTLADGTTLTFTPAINITNPVTVSALNPDGDNVKEFSMSSSNKLLDGTTLSFYNQKNYRWPIDDSSGISLGSVVTGTNVVSGTTTSNYIVRTTLGEEATSSYPVSIVEKELKSIDTFGETATRSVNTSTKIVTETSPGKIIFNNQQPLVLAGDTIKFWSYGTNQIKKASGYDLEFSNLEVELTNSTYKTNTKPTTTTTGTVSNSTTIGVADRESIIQNTSTISGIGITTANPTITSTQADGAGNWTSSTAQTLENGITLTIDNTSRFAVITGDIYIKKVGTKDLTVYFDLEKFLTVA